MRSKLPGTTQKMLLFITGRFTESDDNENRMTVNDQRLFSFEIVNNSHGEKINIQLYTDLV